MGYGNRPPGMMTSDCVASSPKGPSTNVTRILGLHIGNCRYGLGQVLIIEVLGSSVRL